MADQSNKILKQWFQALEKDIKKATPSATGETRKSIHTILTKTGGMIVGGAQINAIIDGRKPTRPGAKKGNPTVQEQMLKYIKALNIRPREAEMTQLSLSWAFAKAIHRDGYEGRGPIYDKVITQQRINSLVGSLLKEKGTAIQSDTIKQFKFA